MTTPVYMLNPLPRGNAVRSTPRWDAGWLGAPLTSFPSPRTKVALLRADRFELPENTIVWFGIDSRAVRAGLRGGRSPPASSKSVLGSRSCSFVGKVMSPKGAFDTLEVVQPGCLPQGERLRLIMIGDVHVTPQRDLFLSHGDSRSMELERKPSFFWER